MAKTYQFPPSTVLKWSLTEWYFNLGIFAKHEDLRSSECDNQKEMAHMPTATGPRSPIITPAGKNMQKVIIPPGPARNLSHIADYKRMEEIKKHRKYMLGKL